MFLTPRTLSAVGHRLGHWTKPWTQKKIQKYIRNQKWSGLLVKNFEGKGRGVMTTRDFKEGEIVCDYHGKVVSGKEGQDIHSKTSSEQTGYMFFYTKKWTIHVLMHTRRHVNATQTCRHMDD